MEGVDGAFCRLEKVIPSLDLVIGKVPVSKQQLLLTQHTRCLASGFWVRAPKTGPPAAFHFWLRLWLPELLAFHNYNHSGRVPLDVSSRT